MVVQQGIPFQRENTKEYRTVQLAYIFIRWNSLTMKSGSRQGCKMVNLVNSYVLILRQGGQAEIFTLIDWLSEVEEP